MSEDREHMSKYARKKAARREEVVKPKVKKPKQPPPELRGALADLHGLPEQCSMLLRNAASQLRTALGIAYEIQAESKKGRQAGEAFAVVGIIGNLPDRAEYAATRVAAMPTKKDC